MAGEKYPVGDVQFDGNELGLSVVVGFLIGVGWRMARNRPLDMVFGAAGIIAGYRSIFRLLKKVQTEQQEENRKWGEKSTSKNQDNHSILPARWRRLLKYPKSPHQIRSTLYTCFDREWNLDPARWHLEAWLSTRSFLGCSIVGLNFHWTVVFVRNLIHDKKFNL